MVYSISGIRINSLQVGPHGEDGWPLSLEIHRPPFQ